jgi:hypothetical protein
VILFVSCCSRRLPTALRASGAGIEEAATRARLIFAVVMARLVRPKARLGLRLVALFTCAPSILAMTFGNSFNARDMRDCCAQGFKFVVGVAGMDIF